MPVKQLPAYQAYEATIYPDRRAVHLYAFTANSAPLRSVSDRESYLVQKCENIPEDATLSSAFLREAFKEFFNTVMHRHPNSAFGLSYAGHGTASGGLFQGSISPVDAQLMLRGWADTYQGKIEFLDFGGNCSEGTFATLLNIAPFANYIVASQLPVGGYTMDDWTYEKYKETKEEEQLPLQLAPGRPILTVLKALLDRRRLEYEYSRNNMTQNRVAQHIFIYDSSSFQHFALAFLPESGNIAINGVYDMYTQLIWVCLL